MKTTYRGRTLVAAATTFEAATRSYEAVVDVTGGKNWFRAVSTRPTATGAEHEAIQLARQIIDSES